MLALQASGGNKIPTRSKTFGKEAKGKGKAVTVASVLATTPALQRTPLTELYIAEQRRDEEANQTQVEISQRMVWEQLGLKVDRALGLFETLCDMDADSDEEDTAGGGGGFEEDEEDDAEDLEDDGMINKEAGDEDRLSESSEGDDNMDDLDDEEDILSDDLEDLDMDGEDDVPDGGAAEPQSARYLAKLRDESDEVDPADGSSTKKRSRRKGKGKTDDIPKVQGKSALDAGFFSLSDFNTQSQQDEEEMRRYMGTGKSKSANDLVMGLDGLEDDDDENEDIDYFAPAIPAEESDEDAPEEDLDEALRPENMRFDDFWLAPSKLYDEGKGDRGKKTMPNRHDKKGKGKAVQARDSDKSSARNRRVSFHDDVTVQEYETDNKKQSPFTALIKKVGMKEAIRMMSTGEFDDEDAIDEEGVNGDEEEEEGDEGSDVDVFSDDGDVGEGGSQDEDVLDDDASETEEQIGSGAMLRIQRDLFADDDDNVSTGRKKSKAAQSRYEQRLAALSEQIAELEQENVAERDWTLRGEVGSRARPLNSLLEEDLEFEQVAKVVPLVTEEASQTLEDLIKKRILDVGALSPSKTDPSLMHLANRTTLTMSSGGKQ